MLTLQTSVHAVVFISLFYSNKIREPKIKRHKIKRLVSGDETFGNGVFLSTPRLHVIFELIYTHIYSSL